jgi:hypothetical protein
MMDDVEPEPNSHASLAQPGLPLPGRPAAAWARRNRVALGAVAGLLVTAAIFGEVAPGVGLTSSARPYNVFHLIAGLVGFGVLAFLRARGAAAFNLGFGSIDLYQAAAGALGVAPAGLFQLGPVDHVIHVVLGVALVAVAWVGRAPAGAAAQTSVIQPSSSGQSPV